MQRHVSLEIDFYLSWEYERVNYVALDADGDLYGYEFPPEFNEKTGVWHAAADKPDSLAVRLGVIDVSFVPEWFGEWYWEVE